MMPPRTFWKSLSAVRLAVSLAGDEEQFMVLLPCEVLLVGPIRGFDADERADLLPLREFEQVGDGSSLGGATHVRDLVDRSTYTRPRVVKNIR